MKPNQSFQEAFKPNSFQTANDSKLFQNTLQNNSDYKRKLYESYYKVQPEEKGDVESGSSQRKSCCCNPRVCWWEPPRENLPLDFCRDTSLHGLKYISQPQRHLTER
ncbi:unnamed protein product [Orchesella dallaii]|uniref:Uncharacterized protein n=1 Tax=Orchesella dallaii TaxID=48710 RepID=A0ABP1QWE0_9HEXA